MRNGQASLEYMVIMAIFMLMLAGTYAISIDMGERRAILESQIEGERTAHFVARNIWDASLAGDGFYSDVFVSSYPEQFILVSGKEVIAIGQGNRSVAIAPIPSSVAGISLVNFSSNKYVRINNTGGTVYVQPAD